MFSPVPHPGQRRNRSRRGAVLVIVLLAMPVLVAAMLLAINSQRLGETRTELQTAADAAARAAALAFVDDRALLGRPEIFQELSDRARDQALRFAAENTADGSAVILDANQANDPDGDIAFGILDTPRSRHLIPVNPRSSDGAYLPFINTVRVAACRTRARGNPAGVFWGKAVGMPSCDVVCRATATLDRDVIGFRPAANVPVPLAPIALRSDPTGDELWAWEPQVEMRLGADLYRFDQAAWRAEFDPNGDGLWEMDVILPAPRIPKKQKGHAQAVQASVWNACLLQLGTEDLGGLARQLRQGVSKQDLAGFGGGLIVPADPRGLAVPGGPWNGDEAAPEWDDFREALRALHRQGERRIWPLYIGFDSETGMPLITGFVAARIVDITEEGGSLNLTLQPCMISTPAAVTDPARREVEGAAVPNRYVCKVRLVN